MTRLIQDRQDLLLSLGAPPNLKLDLSGLQPGINNHHVDIKLSDYFLLVSKELIEVLIKRVIAGQKLQTLGSAEVLDFRRAYEDMVATSLHRTKVDLDIHQAQCLLFAIPKFLLSETRSQIVEIIEDTEERVALQQDQGSKTLLENSQRLYRLRQDQDVLVYRTCRYLFQQVQSVEQSQLKPLRERTLGKGFSSFLHVLYNPMLAGMSPIEPILLFDNYAIWTGGAEAFLSLNDRLEAAFNKLLPELKIEHLQQDTADLKIEPHDALRGLFAVQPLLGKTHDQKNNVMEIFCWLDQPGNIRSLFDASVHEARARILGNEQGGEAEKVYLQFSGELLEAISGIRKHLFDKTQMLTVIINYELKALWTKEDEQYLELSAAAAYVLGETSQIASLDTGRRDVADLLRRLDLVAKDLTRRYKEEVDEYFLRFITDMSRYRLHLKYFRFAHRMFNRLNILTEPEQIQLAEVSSNLYRLIGKDEIKPQEGAKAEIVHHIILKAELRGAAKVSMELFKAGLNPATHFSLHFFEPINALLKKYGAAKVNVEGDAVILGFYEMANAPDQWYGVSRACGMAGEILEVIRAKNIHARKNNLPTLEVGVGVAYRGEQPQFLIDEGRQIMISPAVARASQLSASHKTRRHLIRDLPFNIVVARNVLDDEIQYNIDGILLDEMGFRKLMSEVKLSQFSLKVQDRQELMFVGRYPDLQGKHRDLVVRKGQVARFDGDKFTYPSHDQHYYYEVLGNTKLISKVVSLFTKHLSAT